MLQTRNKSLKRNTVSESNIPVSICYHKCRSHCKRYCFGNCRFDNTVQFLDISGNVLDNLDQTSLRDVGLASLVQLNASRNHISEIHKEAFLEQTKLETVDLSSNSLIFIYPSTFRNNPTLHMLSLSNNKHFRLPEGGSFLSSKSLRVLHLSACNLPHIPPETFRQLPKLQELHISHNQIITLNHLKGVTLLATLDMSHNYLRDLQLSFILALPKLINLNLSFNNLSTLTVNVIEQLDDTRITVHLQGNPWVCDFIMYSKGYCWCLNNWVNWSLRCSNPSRFEGKFCKIYKHEDCEDHRHTDVEQVENFTMINGNLSSNASHANCSTLPPSGATPSKFHEGYMQRDSVYFNISICLAVLLLLLLAILILLCRRYFTSRRSKRTGPAESDVEMCRLSGDNG